MDTLRESVPLCYSKSLGQQQANGSSYMGSPTESYDVITIIQKPTCVVRAALQSLEAQLQPRMVHLILDSCTGIVKALSAYRVRCVEFASALPHFSATAMARYFERKGMAQGKRQGWCASATHAGSAAPQPTAATPLPPARYYQQLVKLAVALQPEVTETVYMWDGDTIALRDFPPARLHDGRFPLLCANPLSPHPPRHPCSPFLVRSLRVPTRRPSLAPAQMGNTPRLPGLLPQIALGGVLDTTRLRRLDRGADWRPSAVKHLVRDAVAGLAQALPAGDGPRDRGALSQGARGGGTIAAQRKGATRRGGAPGHRSLHAQPLPAACSGIVAVVPCGPRRHHRAGADGWLLRVHALRHVAAGKP